MVSGGFVLSGSKIVYIGNGGYGIWTSTG